MRSNVLLLWLRRTTAVWIIRPVVASCLGWVRRGEDLGGVLGSSWEDVRVTVLRMDGLGGVCAAEFNNGRMRTLGGVGFSMRRNRCITVVKRSNSKGAALLGVLTTLSGPATKRMLLGKGGLISLGRGRVSTFEHRRLNFMFRSFGLLSGFSLGSGVFLPLILSNISCERVRGELTPVTSLLKVRGLLGGCPCRISKKRGRETTITHTVVAGPRLVLTSRPAKTLSSGTASDLLELFGEVGRSKRAVLVIARDAGTTDRTGEILFVGSNRIFRRVCHNGLAGSRLCIGVRSTLVLVAANNRGRRWGV